MIPDFTYLEENADRVAGVFLTHGHADAIGALPYFLRISKYRSLNRVNDRTSKIDRE